METRRRLSLLGLRTEISVSMTKISTQKEKEQIITEDVISFLVTLFSDRVVLYRTFSKGMGGWTVIEQGVKDIEFIAGREYFVWSGPITPPKA